MTGVLTVKRVEQVANALLLVLTLPLGWVVLVRRNSVALWWLVAVIFALMAVSVVASVARARRRDRIRLDAAIGIERANA